MKKAGIFKIKAPSNFRGKNWRKIGKVDICTNPFEKKIPLQFASLFWLYNLDTYAILEKSGFFTLQTGNLFYVYFDFTIALFKVQPTDS